MSEPIELKSETKQEVPLRFISYVVGFILSVLLTLAAYLMVVNHLWPMQSLIYMIIGLAIVQLVVQLLFFLHIGRGSQARWKLITFVFAVLVVVTIVAGSLWIMDNLNYNMLKMTPEQQQQYLQDNEGI